MNASFMGCHKYIWHNIINLPPSQKWVCQSLAALTLSNEQGMVAEPVKTDRMWMTGTCLGIHREMLVSDLEHICHATVNDEVIHLSRSTSRTSYFWMTLLNQNLVRDVSSLTGMSLQEFTLAWLVLLYDITFTSETELQISCIAIWMN